MTKRVERSMTCGYCGETFRGYGHGRKGEKEAYQKTIAWLLDHHCLPREIPDPLPRISGVALDAMIEVIRKAMPDVTITRPKV